MDRYGSETAKQVRQRCFQALGNLFDINQGNIAHTAFDPAIVRPVQPATLRRFLLIDRLFLAYATDCAAKPDADIDGSHSLQSSNLVADAYTLDESH